MSEATLAARDLLRRFPLIDGHNDLPWALRERAAPVDLAEPVAGTHTDLPRLAAGGVGAQFWSVFVPASIPGDTAVTTVLEQIDLARRMIAAYPAALELALTAADVERIFAAGRVASLLGAEGGHCIASSLGVLRMLYELGVRYMTLTHNMNVGWADSATDTPAAGGLTDFGRDVVREMQRLGMLVDLSHVSISTMHDALDVAQAPVIFSHSSARALCDSPRNVPDDVLARLADNGGVCMVTFVPGFVSQECADWLAGLKAEAARRGLDPKDFAQLYSIKAEWEAAHPRPQATLAQVADHVEHVRRVAGVEHVGLGGDFDGTPDVTVGLEDVSTYPALFAELLARGWTEPDCAALAGGNLLRALRAAGGGYGRHILTIGTHEDHFPNPCRVVERRWMAASHASRRVGAWWIDGSGRSSIKGVRDPICQNARLVRKVQLIPVYGQRLYTLRHATRALRLARPAAASGRVSGPRRRRVCPGWTGRGAIVRRISRRVCRARPRRQDPELGAHAVRRQQVSHRARPRVRHRGGRLARLVAARRAARRGRRMAAGGRRQHQRDVRRAAADRTDSDRRRLRGAAGQPR